MRKRWAILIGISLVLAGSSFSATRLLSQARPRPLQSEPGLAMLQDYLGLSPEQRGALADVDARYATARPALRDAVWHARDELMNALRDPDSTDEQVISALRQFGRAREEMAINTIGYILQVRRHLTAAQRSKLIGVMDRGICGITVGPGLGRGCGRPGGGACGLGLFGPKGTCGRPGGTR